MQRRAREREKERKASERAAKDAAAAHALAHAEAVAVAAAAEAAALAAGRICDACGGPLPADARQWLRMLDFKYCAGACVAAHRRRLQADAAEARAKR